MFYFVCECNCNDATIVVIRMCVQYMCAYIKLLKVKVYVASQPLRLLPAKLGGKLNESSRTPALSMSRLRLGLEQYVE